MEKKSFVNEELTKKIIGICYKVQNELGAGFLESVYHNALLIALRDEGFSVESEKRLKVHFHGKEVGTFFADIVVEGKVLIELKAVEELKSDHKAQVVNYLKASSIETGLLVNFGKQRVQISRLYKPEKQSS